MMRISKIATESGAAKGGVNFIWQGTKALRRFRTAVSLHSHTMHSEESLAFLPRYAYKIPIVAELVRKQEEKYARNHAGNRLDYSRAYWTPPLPAHEALNLERRQIENVLGLDALVSITDHDSIDACLRLRAMESEPATPVSLEWSVPLDPSFIHLGVHNLPASEAQRLVEKLAGYTHNPDRARLVELLAELNSFENVLVVFNHPLWDEAKAGLSEHRAMVQRFVRGHAEWLHAFELNGLRPWGENRDVIDYAGELGKAVISGGDRHGTEPNSNVNLTNAASFDEFVAEIRRDRTSQVLFMPQYKESPKVRHMETAWDIVRTYPQYPGRTRLLDRVFWEGEPGIAQPLSVLLRREPDVVKYFVATMRLFNCRRVKNALRAALSGQEEMAL